MKRQILGLLWVGIGWAAGPQLHGRIAGKQGPADARQWTFVINGDGQSAVAGVAIQSLLVSSAEGGSCRPLVKSGSFPLPVGDLAAGGSLAARVVLDFMGCSNQARFQVEVQFTGSGGARGILQRNNEYR